MSAPIDRRGFLRASALSGLAAGLASKASGGATAAPDDRVAAVAAPRPTKPYLTKASQFFDVSRGNPRPHSLRGEALEKARLTAATWRLEIVSDGSADITHPIQLEDNTALDMDALKALGKTHGVKFLKAMQCNNIPVPLGQGLWEGVPLRDVLERVGVKGNVRRVYYWGFHNNDPAQMFQSSLPFNRVMESPPWEPPPLVAYKLNGEDIPLVRGGPVRMVIPWAHGFKSIKWLQRIVLTNDYKANDTYALQNNDPESYLKTSAYLDKGETKFPAGEPVLVEGTAMVGWSGLERVEAWVRPATGGDTKLVPDDPAWKSAVWRPCELMQPPADWDAMLPPKTSSREIWGFNPKDGKPKHWPLPFSTIAWSASVEGLSPGAYEFRVRTVDLNGFAQPEPRPYQKSGMNLIPCREFTVSA